MSHRYLPNHHVTPSYAEAMQLYEAGLRADALPRLLAELPTSPCYPFAQGNAAMILLENGQAAQAAVCAYAAIQHFDQHGCTFTPSLVQFSRHLAEAHAAQGHDAQALEWLEIAVNTADGCFSEAQSEAERSQLLNEKAHTLVSWGNSLLNLQHYRSAIERYEEAREIYRQHPSPDLAGVPQALTNLAIAASQVGDLTRADYALHEALTIAQQQHDDDQVQRIRVLAVQIGSSLVPESERLSTLVQAAELAAVSQRWPTAVRRFAIAAQHELRPETAGDRLGLIRCAQECAEHIQGQSIDKCKLSAAEAQVLDTMGAPVEELLPGLLRGAAQWYQLFAQRLGSYDSFAIGRELHWHLRRLADALFRLGRTEESLLAFEAGRALAHLREFNPALIDQLLQRPFFLPEEGRVDLGLLQEIQQSLPAQQAVISIINLPNAFAVYAVRRDGISCEQLRVANTQAELDALMDAVLEIRVRLERDEGIAALPAPVLRMAEIIQRLAGTDTIARLVPHGPLHAVPWRAICRHLGMPWDQLPYATVFSLLPLGIPAAPVDLAQGPVMGLGFDNLGNPVFREEPKEFTQLFAPRGAYQEPCSEQNVRAALTSATILDLSCHGNGRNLNADAELILRLEDPAGGYKDVSLLEVCPEVVAPKLIVLSACYSGVYNMAGGDFPVGGGPLLLQRGVQFCVVMRFAANAQFARDFVVHFGHLLASGATVEVAFARSLQHMEAGGVDLWRDLACVELIAAS